MVIGRVITSCEWRTLTVKLQFSYALLLLIEYLALQIDVHLHCDEWDRALDEGNWEPQQIAAKVSNFLEFLRNVQQNVSPKAIRGD